MSEQLSQKPFSEVLESGEWYPVMSVVEMYPQSRIELYVSEVSEAPDDDEANHAGAFCYRTEVTEVEKWSFLDGVLCGYTGRLAGKGAGMEVFMTEDDEDNLYIRKRYIQD